jgi:hypothetical protein
MIVFGELVFPPEVILEDTMNKNKWRTAAGLALILALSVTQIAAGRFADVDDWGECVEVEGGLSKCRIGSPPPEIVSELGLLQPAVEPPAPSEMGASGTLPVPTYDWYMGCSATSGAMIAAFYDRLGYSDLYTGPTDYGRMPMDNGGWAEFTDIEPATYRVTPLTGTRNGWDGRTTRGSSDDYWIQYGSTAPDPFITNGWAEHAWGDAIGDYMKTSQSTYGNIDGETTFWGYTTSGDPLTCDALYAYDPAAAAQDGTYGRKLFYEARGYTVTECYAQNVDTYATTGATGFTYAQYKAEIDADRPVMINLSDPVIGGHTVVGTGYYDPDTVYLNDTWDWSTHIMNWGGSYAGMDMQSVSIVNLDPLPSPGAFNKAAPADGGYAVADPNLSWSAGTNVGDYLYCIDSIDNDSCDGGTWHSTGAATSASLSGLTPYSTYYWYVDARNLTGLTGADGGTWWSFTVLPVSFSDAPSSHWAWSWIERLYHAGITSGCGGGNYCPNSSVTRAEMAIFLERGIHGSSYTPPAATGTVFGDVPISHWAADWIEQLSADGITGGCGGGNYCPNNPVTRAEMAIFLLRSKHGSGYSPPAATGTVFADVPISHWAAAWIEQLAAEGITSGCGGGNYCPNGAATRAEMAIFLVRTFSLP